MTLRRGLTILVAVLAVVLVLLVAAYAILQRYVIYSDSGTHIELPFFQKEEPEPTGDDIHIVVESPSPAPTAAGQEQPEREETGPLHAVQLPEQALAEGTAENYAVQHGANAVVVDLKRPDGTLTCALDLELARRIGAEPGQGEGLEEAVSALNEGTLYTVARICCFRDGLLYTADRSYNILTNSGYLWRDETDVCWASPASQAVRDYLTDIARAAAELGFDEVLLDYAGYPTQGQLGWIKTGESYPTGQLDGWIGQFYEQVARALEPYGVKLSVRTTAQAVEGTDALSGQTAENLAAWADRVWLERPDAPEDCAAALEAAGAERGGEMLVFLTEQPGSEAESWAVQVQTG